MAGKKLPEPGRTGRSGWVLTPPATWSRAQVRRPDTTRCPASRHRCCTPDGRPSIVGGATVVLSRPALALSRRATLCCVTTAQAGRPSPPLADHPAEMTQGDPRRRFDLCVPGDHSWSPLPRKSPEIALLSDQGRGSGLATRLCSVSSRQRRAQPQRLGLDEHQAIHSCKVLETATYVNTEALQSKRTLIVDNLSGRQASGGLNFWSHPDLECIDQRCRIPECLL